MVFLRESTTTTITLGPFVDDTDAKTAETGLAGSMTVQLSKGPYSAGTLTMGAFANRNSATAISHDAAGYYSVPLNTTDTNTKGPLKIKATASGALAVWADFVVLDADIYDAMVLGTSPFPIGISPTALGNVEDDYDGTGYAKPNSSIGTVGTVTNEVSADVVKISGDVTAANNAEAMFDGTGYHASSSSIGSVGTAVNVLSVAGEVSANVTKIGGDAGTLAKLAAIANAATMGSVAAGTITSSSFPTDLSEATNDHFIGGAIKFYTGALAGQLGYISDYDGATKTITVSPALTEAPTAGDDFIIV